MSFKLLRSFEPFFCLLLLCMFQSHLSKKKPLHLALHSRALIEREFAQEILLYFNSQANHESKGEQKKVFKLNWTIFQLILVQWTILSLSYAPKEHKTISKFPYFWTNSPLRLKNIATCLLPLAQRELTKGSKKTPKNIFRHFLCTGKRQHFVFTVIGVSPDPSA